jgi:hypothetical protein
MNDKPYHGPNGQRWQRGKRWDGHKWVSIERTELLEALREAINGNDRNAIRDYEELLGGSASHTVRKENDDAVS